MAIAKINTAHYMGYSSPPSLHGPEEASQTFVEGAILVPDASSGEIEEAGADPTNIAGVAEHAASGTAGTDVKFTPALPGVVFEMTLAGGAAADHTLVAGDLFARYGLVVQTTVTPNRWVIDASDTTNDRVVIVGLRDPIGTVNGRVYAVFLSEVTMFGALTVE